MRSLTHQSITAVEPCESLALLITWEDGSTDRVDLSSVIASSKHLKPLMDPLLFSKASVGEWGWDVHWTDDLELSAAQLWRWAGEQSDHFMAPEEFRAWRERNHLSLSGAAEMLGMSRRMIVYYETGEKIIPKYIKLACKGADMQTGNAA